MKKLSIFLLAFLIVTVSFGQIEWVYTDGSNENYALELVKTDRGEYAILHSMYEVTPLQLTVIDSVGNVKHSLSSFDLDPTFDVLNFIDILLMPDSSIAVLTENYPGGDNILQGILRFDHDLNPTQSFILGLGNDYDGSSLFDGGFAILNRQNPGIFRLAADGSTLWFTYLTGYNCEDIATTADNIILVATAQGLLLLDMEGSIVSEYSNFIFDRIKIKNDGEIIGVKDGEMLLLSEDYSLVASVEYSGEKIDDFAFKNDTIVVLTDSNYVYIYSDSLNLLNSFQLFEDGTLDFITIGSGRVVLSGAERYGSTNYNEHSHATFIKEFSFEGDGYGISNDVGVVSAEQLGETSVQFLGSTSYNVIFKEIKVTVRNFGSNPVASVTLGTKPNKLNKFDGFLLQPGDEIELVWDEVVRYYSTDPAGTLAGLCFWTAFPDDLMDLDASNDYTCAEFLVNDKETFAESGITIFPNPISQGQLHLQLTDGLILTGSLALHFTNALGQSVFSAPFTPAVDVSGLGAGLYFLQIQNDNGEILQTEKIIVK